MDVGDAFPDRHGTDHQFPQLRIQGDGALARLKGIPLLSPSCL